MILSKNNDYKWLQIKTFTIFFIFDFHKIIFYSCKESFFIVAKKFFV